MNHNKNNEDGLQFIQRLNVAVFTSHTMPKDLKSILLTGLAKYEKGEAKTLDEAFGIRGAGMKSVCYLAKIEARNKLIRSLADLTCSNLVSWEKAERVAKIVSQFESCSLSRIKTKSNHENTPKFHLILLECFELGVTVPTSKIAIYNILNLKK